MNNDIIEIQGITLTPEAIEAIKEIQEEAHTDDCITTHVDDISHFLIEISRSLDIKLQLELLSCLQMLNDINSRIKNLF